MPPWHACRLLLRFADGDAKNTLIIGAYRTAQVDEEPSAPSSELQSPVMRADAGDSKSTPPSTASLLLPTIQPMESPPGTPSPPTTGQAPGPSARTFHAAKKANDDAAAAGGGRKLLDREDLKRLALRKRWERNLPSAIQRLRRSRNTHTIVLDPLRPADVATMLKETLG